MTVESSPNFTGVVKAGEVGTGGVVLGMPWGCGNRFNVQRPTPRLKRDLLISLSVTPEGGDCKVISISNAMARPGFWPEVVQMGSKLFDSTSGQEHNHEGHAGFS